MQIKTLISDKEDRKGHKKFLKLYANITETKMREILDDSVALRGEYDLTCQNSNCVVTIPLDWTNFSGFGEVLFQTVNAED